MSRITISYAGTNITKEVSSDVRVQDLLNDVNIKGVLGFSKVEAQIDGQKMSGNEYLADGDVITLVNVACEKA